MEVTEPDGPMSSFFLLFSLVGVFSCNATVPMKRPRALNMRKRRRVADKPIMAKTPCSMLLKRMTTNPITKMMRSCHIISSCMGLLEEGSYRGRYFPIHDQCTWGCNQITNCMNDDCSE